MLVELGLMSLPHSLEGVLTIRVKRPFVHNGNTTFQLMHTRYISSESNAEKGPVEARPADEEDTNQQVQEDQPLDIIGLSRDQTIGHQVRTAVGDGPWEKRVFPSNTSSTFGQGADSRCCILNYKHSHFVCQLRISWNMPP